MYLSLDNLERLEIGASVHFHRAIETTKVNYKPLVTHTKSTGAGEDYAFMRDNVQMREWVGERVVQQLGAHTYTLPNKTWECTIGLERDQIADNKLGEFFLAAAQQGEAAAKHPQQQVFSLLRRGFTDACHTKKPFFAADHPHASGEGAFSNILDKSLGVQLATLFEQGRVWFLACCDRVIRPFIEQEREPLSFVTRTDVTADNLFKHRRFEFGADYRGAYGFSLPQLCVAVLGDLTADHYDEAVQKMASFTTASRERMGLVPTHLIHGAKHRRKAKELLKAQKLANGADNTYFGEVTPIEAPSLF